MSDDATAPIHASITVACPPAFAFEFFTARIADWWPMRTHSLGEEKTTDVIFDSGAGGRIYEVNPTGEEIWGTVIEWEPPRRILYTWHPGRPTSQATTVEVTFEAHPDGTQVLVEHRDWHRLGAEAARMHAQYSAPDAWNGVLALLKSAAEREGAS